MKLLNKVNLWGSGRAPKLSRTSGPLAGQRSHPFRTHCDKFLAQVVENAHSQLSSTNESIRQRGKNKAEEKNSGLLHAFSFSSITKAALGGPLVTHSNRGGFILARFFYKKTNTRHQCQISLCSKCENSKIYFAFWLERSPQPRVSDSLL